MDWGSLIKDVGFPIFVAVFVLVRLEPAIKRLDSSITALTIVAAKSNGMAKREIAEVIEAVKSRKHKNRGRRVTDKLEVGYEDEQARR